MRAFAITASAYTRSLEQYDTKVTSGMCVCVCVRVRVRVRVRACGFCDVISSALRRSSLLCSALL